MAYFRTKHRAGIANLTSCRSSLLLCICIFVALTALSGCSKTARQYKHQADEEVYQTIDSAWKKTNIEKVDYDIEADQSAASVNIEDQLPTSGILTLPEAVRIAVTYNRQYQTEKETLYIKALDLTLIRHVYESNPFLNAEVGYDGTGAKNEIGGDITYGFSKLLRTGTQITSSVALAWTDILTGNLRSGLGTIFSAMINKPLLRGSSREIVLENLTQAQRDTLYQIRTFNRFRKEFVVSIITGYYRLLQQHNLAQNARSNYDTLNETYTHMQKFVINGRLPQHELEQAHQDRLHAWDISINEEKLYQQMLDDFKIAMSIAPTNSFQLDHTQLEHLTEQPLPPPSFNETQAIQTALAQRLDLMNTADAIEDAQRKVKVAEDSLRAELNIVAASRSKPGLDIMKNYTDDITAGLQLDLPLDRKAERNQYRMAIIALQQQTRNHAQAIDNIEYALRQAYRDLNNAAETYSLQQDSLDLAARRFKSTSLLIQYDRANTRDVLDAQKDFFNAKNDATVALVDYTVAMLDFYRDAGVLQIKPDGMWITPKTVDKPTLASDDPTSLTNEKSQTNSSEEAIKIWMKNQTVK